MRQFGITKETLCGYQLWQICNDRWLITALPHLNRFAPKVFHSPRRQINAVFGDRAV
jgi:hypothetical protein